MTGFGGAPPVYINTIYVCNLPPGSDEELLAELFGQIGLLKKDKRTGRPKIWIYRDKGTNEPKGDATVSYEDPHAAAAAVDWFNNTQFHGSLIKVSIAESKTEKEEAEVPPVMEVADPVQDQDQALEFGNDGDMAGDAAGGGRGRGRGDAGAKAWQQEGDWPCPNPSCANINVAFRGVCNRCGTARPSGGAGGGGEALNRLKESEPGEWLAAPPALVHCAKQASEILFSLTADNFGKAPLSKLYTDRFDAEQIWQQIDLQSHPVVSYIRKKLKSLEKSGDNDFFTGLEEKKNVTENGKPQLEGVTGQQVGADGEDDSEDDASDDDEMEDSEEAALNEEEEDDDDDDDDDDDEEEEEADNQGDKSERKNGVDDDFLRVSEMEKFLDRADAEGVFGTGGGDDPQSTSRLDDDEEGDENDDDDEDVEDFEAGGISSADEDGDKDLGFGTYEDFFGQKKKQKKKTKSKPLQEEEKNSDEDELPEENGRDEEGPNSVQLETKPLPDEKLSTHERRQERIEKKMRQLEKASLDPKDWTLQGEVTAKKRPKNSALEVELDFEHNVRPPPVITEEVTASLEDMIKARIAEARFDDVHRKAAAPVAAVKERVELDESKSQKGLGEIYEAEYMQQTGLAAAPTSTTEALKEEAKELFKALCARLDALSHFHFAPKPVIEDMEVRADVPALAMEEVAPVAVSEASMLAPEEIFAGDDAIKGEGELTPEERKRRRAQKKRKRKGEKRVQEAERSRKRIRPIGAGAASEEVKPTEGLKIGHSSYSKSTKVFAELDRVKGGKAPPQKDDKLLAGKPLHASFLKL